MNKYLLIGIVASQPYKAFVLNKRQMYSFSVHTTERGYTESIPVIVDENLAFVKVGSKYLFKGSVVARNVNDVFKFYVQATIVIPTDAEDANRLEVIGKLYKKGKVYRHKRQGETLGFVIQTDDKPMSWIDARCVNIVTDYVMKIPVNSYLYATGKLQGNAMERDGKIKFKYHFRPFMVKGLTEREVKEIENQED